MTPRLRPALPADLGRILEIQSRWPSLAPWSREHFLRDIASERAYVAVLDLEGEIRGFGALILIPPEAQVSTLAVDPEVARRGLGRILLGHLLETARSRGCAEATLEVSAENAAALALYRSLGFAESGRRRGYYPDGTDAVLMAAPVR